MALIHKTADIDVLFVKSIQIDVLSVKIYVPDFSVRYFYQIANTAKILGQVTLRVQLPNCHFIPTTADFDVLSVTGICS